jgi:hypothetical protein
MADRSLIPLELTATESVRKWALPASLKQFSPLLDELPGHPRPPHDALYEFAHRTDNPDTLRSRGYVNEFARALYIALLQQRGVALAAEVKTTSKHVSPQALQHTIGLLPVDQGVAVGTKFHLQVDAKELTEVHSHHLSLPAEKKWTTHPFENVVLMVLRPGESLDLTVRVIEGEEGNGAHELACSVGIEVETVLGASGTPKERRALATYKRGLVRFKTPPQMRPKALALRALRDMELCLQRLQPSAERVDDESFLVALPETPAAAGLAMLVARVVYILYDDTPYVAPDPDVNAIKIRGKSEGAVVTKIERAAKSLAGVCAGIIKSV